MFGVRVRVGAMPHAINGDFQTAKLATGLHSEEVIPTTIGEKIPLLGRFFKASNTAYNGAALELRAEIFNDRYDRNVKNGMDMTNKENLQSLGTAVNAFTGRGDVGMLNGENVNALVFSVRLAKSKFDVLTAHIFSNKVSVYEKQQAAWRLLRLIGTAGSLMLLANTINPGSAEFDPRATNFGKIRIGNTWYPTPLSVAGIPNLLFRTLIRTQHNGQWGLWMKNGQGKFTNLLAGKYGQITAVDIFNGYFEGKASPMARAILDTLNGKDFNGNKSTLTNEAKNLITPINIGNIAQTINNPKETYKTFNIFMQFLGSNTSPPK
jgi:hypothetical protein